MHGIIGMLLSADNLSSDERIILRSCLNTTASIAGCQAIRSKISHCCFGFRVAQGEVIFVTASPDRRHSSLILHLSRTGEHDTSLCGEDDVAQHQTIHCGFDSPKIFSRRSISEGLEGEHTSSDTIT